MLPPMAPSPTNPMRAEGMRSDGHRFAEAPEALEVVAVLPMPRGVLGLRQQEAVAVVRLRLRVVLQQAGRELLVVRVVADFRARAGQRLDQRCAGVAPVEVRG